jgi:hypothetical protein
VADRGSVPGRAERFILAILSSPAVGPTQPLRVGRAGEAVGPENDDLQHPSTEAKKEWSYASTPHWVFMASYLTSNSGHSCF